jgi:protein-export membrane protein SecD
MEAGLVARLIITVASCVAGAWMLTPTFAPPEVQAEITRVCDLEKVKVKPEGTPEPQWYTEYLPCNILVRGLDLQGGIDLTLYVDVDEAVRSTVQREVQPLKAAAKDKGVALVDVRRDRREPVLIVQPAAGVTAEAVTAVVNDRLQSYTYLGTVDEGGSARYRYGMSDTRASEIRKQAVEQAREVIDNRINSSGVKEPSITRRGDTGINVQLPGESDIEKAKASFGTTAQLEFLLVDEEADHEAVAAAAEALIATLPAGESSDDQKISDALIDAGTLRPGQRLYWHNTDDVPAQRTNPLVLKEEVLLTGDDIATAYTNLDTQAGQYYVALDFKPHGSAVFSEVTGNNVGKRLAIVLDGRLRSAPTVQSKISGTASITVGGVNMQDSFDNASDLARFLRSGALPAPVTVGEVRQIGPQLGDQAIQDGSLASILGCLLVFILAGVYYRVSGVLADISLAVNAVLCLALLVAVNATLTLPGICGIALTIGMAVDANIIVFERIREELRQGKVAANAIDIGFDRAGVAVIDANICTLLAAVVLYSYGTGPLKGFAVTLGLGIFTTVFTGLFVTRALMELAFTNRNRTTVSI